MLSAFMSTIAVIAAEAAFEASRPAPAPVAEARTAADPAAPKAAPQPLKTAASTAAEPATPAAAAPAQAAFAGLSDREVESEVLKQLEALTTMKGDFVQTAPSGAVATGKFYLRRPGQIRFDYDDPSPITIVATGGFVYVENGELETTDSYPLKKTPLRFLLGKKIDIPDAALKSVDRTADRVALTYASDDEEGGEITLFLSAPGLAIEQWAVRDPAGGVTVVALQGVTTGGALENRLFRVPEAGGAFINK